MRGGRENSGLYRVDLADKFTVYCGDALNVLKTLSSERRELLRELTALLWAS